MPIDDLHHPEAQELLRTQPLVRLAYTGMDGFPRVIPIGFWWDGNRLTVHTAPNAPKVRTLAAHPQVALTIDTWERPTRALLIRGLVTIEMIEGVPESYRAANPWVLDDPRYLGFEAHACSVAKRMAWIWIEPTWARYYDFESRIPDFLHHLEQP